MKNRNGHFAHSESNIEECISSDLLFRFVEKKTHPQENEEVYKHLNECQACYRTVAEVMRELRQPSREEEKEIEALLKMSPDEQVAKIISYHRKLNPVKRPGLAERLTETIKRLTAELNPNRLILRPAVAVLTTLLVAFGIFRGVQFYNTGYQILLAKNDLQKEYKIPFQGAVQLAGGYESRGGAVTMGREEPQDYLQKAKARIDKALQNKSESQKAQQLLAQIFIIEGSFAKADSVFSIIEKEPTESASILNDLGVLHFQKKDWEKAADYFHQAIKSDASLPEAHYNLALAEEKLGRFNEAISDLNRYMELEKDQGWKRAAQSAVSEIEARLEQQ